LQAARRIFSSAVDLCWRSEEDSRKLTVSEVTGVNAERGDDCKLTADSL